MYTVSKLKYGYKDRDVLNNISFKIKVPSIISIVGSNNSGKTTLIKCLSGVMPISGEVKIDDVVMSKKTIKKYIRGLGVVFSSDMRQFLFDKVIDEATFPLCNLDYNKKKIKETVKEISNLLDMDNILDKEIKELSDFDRLKVLLMTSVIHKPKVLLLDDVLIYLTVAEKNKILSLLKKLVDEMNMIIIMTTSNLQDTIYSNAILVIDDGSIKYSGNLDSILSHDNTLTKIGIDIPIMTDMSLKLKFYNLLDEVILDEKEMVDILWQ